MRCIFYCDLLSFLVSIERAVDIKLERRPVVIAGGGPRSPLMAASPEARMEGITTSMSLGEALKFCPKALVLPPNKTLYRKASRAILKILGEFSPIVEPAAPGHAYLDMTGVKGLLGSPLDAAARINREIRTRLGLFSTIGLAENKFMSNVAAHYIKPDPVRSPGLSRPSSLTKLYSGVYSIPTGEEEGFLAPLNVSFIPEVREKNNRLREKLEDFNIETIRDLQVIPLTNLGLAFGNLGHTLHGRARGIDTRPVMPSNRGPEVVREEVLSEDTNDRYRLKELLRRLVLRAGYALRKRGVMARKLGLALEYSDYYFVEKTAILPSPADLDTILFSHAASLFNKMLTRRIRIRAMSIYLTELCSPSPLQGELFLSRDKTQKRLKALQGAVDRINERFGKSVIGYQDGFYG